jgi:hypothetical protein
MLRNADETIMASTIYVLRVFHRHICIWILNRVLQMMVRVTYIMTGHLIANTT